MDPLQKSKEDEKEIINNNTDNDDGDGDFNDKICRYDTVSDVVESKVHQCQQNSDA